MKRHVPVAAGGSRLTPAGGLTLLEVAVVLMLAGVLMIFTGVSAAISIAVIAIGIALTAIVETDRHRRSAD